MSNFVSYENAQALFGAVGDKFDDVFATIGANGAKNLLDNTYNLKKVASGSQLDGLTVTRRSDGAVVLNGTVSGSGNQGYVEVFKTTNFQFDGMILSGKNSNAITAAKLGLWDETASAGLWLETTEEATISGMNGHTVRVTLNIYGGNTFDNMVFLPMLRLATDPDSTYAPYAMTNKQLTDALAYLEQTVTLSTSAATAVTFTDARITANSCIEVGTSEWGLVPDSVTVSAGSCVVTLPQAETAHSVVCRIYLR